MRSTFYPHIFSLSVFSHILCNTALYRKKGEKGGKRGKKGEKGGKRGRITYKISNSVFIQFYERGNLGKVARGI